MSPDNAAAHQGATLAREEEEPDERPEEAPPIAREQQTEPVQPAAPAPGFTPKSPMMTAAYMLAATVIALTQGLGMAFISTNIQQIAGPLEATTTEATWLMAAYLAPNVSLALLLFKLRTQYGIRNFAEIAIIAYVLVSLTHFWVDDFETAMIVRFFAGVAGAPMSSVAFLYMLEPVSPQKKLSVGLCAALTALALSTPVSGLISPSLLDLGGWHALYLVEMGLALVCLAAIYLLPLASQPRAKVISRADLVSFFFLAVGLGALAVVLTVGRIYWWTEAPWLGWLLAAGIASLTLVALIELQRDAPLLDIRWLTSREIIHFTGALLLFRLILSEQSSGAIAFFRNIGLLNEQMAGLYWVVLLSTVAAGILCASVMKPGREAAIHAVALLLLALGCYLDSRTTILTRPSDMFLSQMLVSFASGLFLPPALAVGLMSALKRGPNYILSFIIVFLTTQKVGALLGSALFGSFVTLRQQFHAQALTQHLTPGDPLVAARLQQLGAAYGKVLTDPAQQSAQAASLLAKQTSQQAYVLAYNDAFLAMSFLALAALACLLVHVIWREFARLNQPTPVSAAA